MHNRKHSHTQVKKYGKQLGDNGQQDGKKIAYILVDKIFTRQVLTCFSWTGTSRSKAFKHKLAFLNLRHIRHFLYLVVSNANNRITEPDMDNFLKNSILKHANNRAGFNEGRGLAVSIPTPPPILPSTASLSSSPSPESSLSLIVPI